MSRLSKTKETGTTRLVINKQKLEPRAYEHMRAVFSTAPKTYHRLRISTEPYEHIVEEGREFYVEHDSEKTEVVPVESEEIITFEQHQTTLKTITCYT